jgi:hypothetical protein
MRAEPTLPRVVTGLTLTLAVVLVTASQARAKFVCGAVVPEEPLRCRREVRRL